MADDDTFKRYEEAGAAFVEAALGRAATLLRGLSDLGPSTVGPIEDLLGAGRQRGDQLLGLIRAEVGAQLSPLGLATRADLAALEGRVSALESEGARAPKAKRTTVKKTSAKKASTKKASAQKAPAKKAPARKVVGAGRGATPRARADDGLSPAGDS